MLNTFFKSILLVLILSLSACSDTRENKEQTESKITKVEEKKKFNKPQYDLYLDIHKDARMWYETADLTESAYNIGLIYDTKINDNKWAEFWYKRAIELDDKNIDARKNLGVLYKKKGDFNSAITLYKKNIEYGDINSSLNLAILYEDINEYNLATKWYDFAIEREFRCN